MYMCIIHIDHQIPLCSSACQVWGWGGFWSGGQSRVLHHTVQWAEVIRPLQIGPKPGTTCIQKIILTAHYNPCIHNVHVGSICMYVCRFIEIVVSCILYQLSLEFLLLFLSPVLLPALLLVSSSPSISISPSGWPVVFWARQAARAKWSLCSVPIRTSCWQLPQQDPEHQSECFPHLPAVCCLTLLLSFRQAQRKMYFRAIGRFLGLCFWFRFTIPLMVCRHVAKYLLGRCEYITGGVLYTENQKKFCC